jgi:hypothetical protein
MGMRNHPGFKSRRDLEHPEGSSEQFIHEFSEREKRKTWFSFFSQNQRLNVIDFGGTSLCRRKL